MDYKKNIKYFENKKILMYGSAVLLAVGVILWFGPFWSPDNYFVMYIFSVLSIIIGGVIFAITLGKRSNDKKIDEQINEVLKHFEEETLQKYDLYERQLPYVESAVIEGYKYFDGSLLRRDKDGKFRTEIYVKTHVYFTEEELCIGSKEISLIKDEQADKSEKIPYANIKKACLSDDETIYKKGNKTVPVKYQTLHIVKTDGTEFTAQTRSSQTVDTLVSDINHIRERKVS